MKANSNYVARCEREKNLFVILFWVWPDCVCYPRRQTELTSWLCKFYSFLSFENISYFKLKTYTGIAMDERQFLSLKQY